MAVVLGSKDAKRFIKLMAEVKPDQQIKQKADRGRLILASINKLKRATEMNETKIKYDNDKKCKYQSYEVNIDSWFSLGNYNYHINLTSYGSTAEEAKNESIAAMLSCKAKLDEIIEQIKTDTSFVTTTTEDDYWR